MPIQGQAELILSGFGLQVLKAKAFNFGTDEEDGKSPVATSFLGTPVFSNIDFIEGSYRNLEGDQVNYLQGGTPGLTVDTVLMTVSQSRNIVTTPIQGRNGTVKEYISDGDYDVTIRGAIVHPSPNVYPEEDVLKLVEALRVQDNIEVASRYLNDVFGITNLVVTGYSLPQTEGFQNTQFFEIKAISDDPIEITIRN